VATDRQRKYWSELTPLRPHAWFALRDEPLPDDDAPRPDAVELLLDDDDDDDEELESVAVAGRRKCDSTTFAALSRINIRI
jgi:hypothetical protein